MVAREGANLGPGASMSLLLGTVSLGRNRNQGERLVHGQASEFPQPSSSAQTPGMHPLGEPRAWGPKARTSRKL